MTKNFEMAESHGATKSINVNSIDLTREKPIKTVEMLNGEKISKKIFEQLCLTLTYFVGVMVTVLWT